MSDVCVFSFMKMKKNEKKMVYIVGVRKLESLGCVLQFLKVQGRVGCKYLRGCSRQSFKLFTITLRKPNDIANGLENSRNLRHCSRN